jgi:phosphatidylglycerophosphate synthase
MHELGGTLQAAGVERRETPRTAWAGPVAGLIALVLLLAALAGSVGLSAGGWLAGGACGLIVNASLARGIARHGTVRLGPADWVTLTRATLAAGVAALVADSLGRSAPVALLVAMTVVALALDAVDGWIVRRAGTATGLGARFDGEVDAFLILVLSIDVAHDGGAWVLAIGAARYAFLVAGWLLPWMRTDLPPRHWRKVVAATQGVVLAFAVADVFPRVLTRSALAIALALLAESFGRDVWWLWRRRGAGRASRTTAARTRSSGRGRVRPALAVVLSILALAIVWIALVAPDQLNRLTPGAFARLPLEGLVLIALALVLPARARIALACLAGPFIGVLVILKVLDMGFFEAFDRPFDPVADGSYTGIGIETLRDSIGRTDANLAVAGAALLGLGVLVLTTLALLRLTRVAAANRRSSLTALTALTALWGICWLAGAQVVSYAPVASTSAVGMVAHEFRAVRAGVQDHAVFADDIRHDRFAGTPADKLLTGLRGKDVILAFVESYGKVAVQGSSFSPQVDKVLANGDRQLKAAGFSSRSAFLTSSTFGGLSWLAHSTLQSGVWVDNQLRYDQLVKTQRLTLSVAFKRAGWRTVGDVPSNNRTWPEGSSFYHYDKLYDRRDVGYRGPKFSYASMPDQYVFAALQRLELAKSHRRPVFAEVDLVSSHTPWTRIPKMIPWSAVGDGSIYRHMPVDDLTRAQLFSDSDGVHAAYGQSIEYTMNALVSFVQHDGDKNLVLVVLGDHQPAKVITGENPSHDVPISVIAHDPAVLDRISGWGWNAGLRPSPSAPVWRMDAFRNRFLSAFGS